MVYRPQTLRFTVCVLLTMLSPLIVVLGALCLMHPKRAGADQALSPYRTEACRTYQSIEIDGELSESDWQNAKPISQFVQLEPDEGRAVTQPMEARILYDEKNIYFGFVCADSDFSKLVANEMRRDGSGRDGLRENDHIFILLDTYNDSRSGFFFRVNPLGAMEDIALMDNGESRNQDWDAVWTARTKMNGDNWTAEIEIPFSQLRFAKSEKMTWGMNVGRSIPRNQEEATWVPLKKAHGFWARYRTDNLGSLVGLEGITPKRNLELLPYFLPGVNRTKAEKRTEGVFDIGLDVKYGITPNLIADVTFNTDFAQVESDQERVNLTRFSLFFPEKRPFFLEGAGMFDFGIPRTSTRRPPPLLLFYSRRIGLAEDRAVPIIAGGKMTGKAGPFSLGILNVTTDEIQIESSTDEPQIDSPTTVPTTNFSVLRVKRDIGSGSSVGIIAINKQDASTHNRSGGFDFVYRPTDNINVRGLWARTSGQGNGLYLGSGWQNTSFRLRGAYMDISEDFNPEVGYIRRTGVRYIRGELRYTPWVRKFGVRRIWMGPELDLILNQENNLQTLNISLVSFFRFENGAWVAFLPRRTSENLEEDFEIREGIIIPIGEYRFTEWRFRASTDDTKAIAGEFGMNFGSFYNGNRRGFNVDVAFKPNGRFSIAPQFEFNRVTLPVPGGSTINSVEVRDEANSTINSGEVRDEANNWRVDSTRRVNSTFNASIFGGRASYSFSTSFFAKIFAQWNSDDDVIGTNFLLNYIYRPGSDFYLVFNQTYETKGTKPVPLDSTVGVKMTYWWNP